MATINLNQALEWLKKRQIASERNRRLFEGRPTVPASEAWGGYQDSPGGQRLMVRQMQRPEVTNKLVSKNDGTQTLTKTWKDPDASDFRATGLGYDPETHPVNLQPWPVRKAYWGNVDRERNLRDMVSAQEEGLQRGQPERISQIDQIRRMIHEQPRSGSSILRDDRDMRPMGGVNITNLGIPIRAMGDIIRRMQRGYQGIDDRIERNRIRRLMQYRTTNPYFPTGGRY
jgi:hypothetical protein